MPNRVGLAFIKVLGLDNLVNWFIETNSIQRGLVNGVCRMDLC